MDKEPQSGFSTSTPGSGEAARGGGARQSADRPALRVPAKTARRFNEDLGRAGIAKSGPGGVLDFHSLRTTYVNLILESGAGVKEAMDLARHSTPDLTMNVYGRSRWERRAELVGHIGEAVLSGLKNGPENITGPERKVANLDYSINSMLKMAGSTGLEPANPSL